MKVHQAIRVVGWGSLMLSCCLVGAEPFAPTTMASSPTVDPAPLSTPLRIDGSSLARAGLARAASDPRPTDRTATASITIIELPRSGPPNNGTPGSQRAHHALSIDSERPARMLRSLGLDASHCATRLRMPSKLRRDGEGVNLDVQAHVGLACRF